MINLSDLKLYLDIEADDTHLDDRLRIILIMCRSYAVGYCHLDSYDERLDTAVYMMAAETLTKCSSEGLTSRSMNGISESYIGSFSPAVLTILNTMRHISSV